MKSSSSACFTILLSLCASFRSIAVSAKQQCDHCITSEECQSAEQRLFDSCRTVVMNEDECRQLAAESVHVGGFRTTLTSMERIDCVLSLVTDTESADEVDSVCRAILGSRPFVGDAKGTATGYPHSFTTLSNDSRRLDLQESQSSCCYSCDPSLSAQRANHYSSIDNHLETNLSSKRQMQEQCSNDPSAQWSISVQGNQRRACNHILLIRDVPLYCPQINTITNDQYIYETCPIQCAAYSGCPLNCFNADSQVRLPGGTTCGTVGVNSARCNDIVDGLFFVYVWQLCPMQCPIRAGCSTAEPTQSPVIGTVPSVAPTLSSPTESPFSAPTISPTDAPVPTPTGAPYPAPTASPTDAPIQVPVPVSVPLPVPVPVPVPVPIPVPASVPVPIPTAAPVTSPVSVPAPLPVPVPVPVPMPISVPAPLPVPVPAPLPAPVPLPVNPPNAAPVEAPVPVPVPAPVLVPVLVPVSVPAPAPIPLPLDVPSTIPVNQPVTVPVNTPLSVPVSQPVALPIQVPVPVPVDSPVSVPLNPPRPMPVDPPIAVAIPTAPIPVNQPVFVPVVSPVPVPLNPPLSMPINPPVAVTVPTAPIPVSLPVFVPVNPPVVVPINPPVVVPVDAPIAVPVNQPIAFPVAAPLPLSTERPVTFGQTASETPSGNDVVPTPVGVSEVEVPVVVNGDFLSVRLRPSGNLANLTKPTNEIVFVKLTLTPAEELNQEEIQVVLNALKEEFDGYLKGEADTQRHLTGRRLARRRDARDLKTEFVFVRQDMVVNEDGTSSSLLVYNQTLSFLEKVKPIDLLSSEDPTESPLDDNDPRPNFDDLSAEQIAVMPFTDYEANVKMAQRLKDETYSLNQLKVPLPVPTVSREEENSELLSVGDDDSGDEISEGAIAGIFLCCALLFSVIGSYGVYRLNQEITERSGGSSPRSSR
ncbi:hypothetical protein FisN_25Lh047 [Fistulifera solaris]|uniref:Uncharacterized protein n=1 Tax=Fistulifera solaris TaxID=1519565 RepID=A0A1Z5JLU4_FISSO|nr:hypothetical protein FisN_25Lh047 [Fistulifera solaris]|eukprot:GAX14758.1 hypothetical protein FisN_25Lh047 [Fistulifera solaris]